MQLKIPQTMLHAHDEPLVHQKRKPYVTPQNAKMGVAGQSNLESKF